MYFGSFRQIYCILKCKHFRKVVKTVQRGLCLLPAFFRPTAPYFVGWWAEGSGVWGKAPLHPSQTLYIPNSSELAVDFLASGVFSVHQWRQSAQKVRTLTLTDITAVVTMVPTTSMRTVKTDSSALILSTVPQTNSMTRHFFSWFRYNPRVRSHGTSNLLLPFQKWEEP